MDSRVYYVKLVVALINPEVLKVDSLLFLFFFSFFFFCFSGFFVLESAA